MSIRNQSAFLCIAIVAISEIGLGLVYLTASEAMPYHKQALGSEWSQLEPGARMLLLTLLNGYGSTHLAVGIALGALLLYPIRRGQLWARWAILATGLPVLGATAFLSHRLASTTGANVPWPGAVGLLGLFVLGVALADPRAQTQQNP
ncbi:MAG: hypothetical protein JNJ88_18255 [Planctomycetes bacterium]|nr:hypothetical protein [Planctomycetota bacterium]